MLLMFLPAANEGNLPWGERLATSGLTLLIGMVLIFLILAVLIGVIYLMNAIFHRSEKKASEPEPEPQTYEPAPRTEEELSEETVAAIAAAVAVCMQEETGAPAPFRIRSIKKRV